VNLCRNCGEDFGSVQAFDAHRVGTHAYLWSLERQDGRRCLDIEEMEARGFVRNARGGWSLVRALEAARSLREREYTSHRDTSGQVAP
jgi:hypothetical protein